MKSIILVLLVFLVRCSDPSSSSEKIAIESFEVPSSELVDYGDWLGSGRGVILKKGGHLWDDFESDFRKEVKYDSVGIIRIKVESIARFEIEDSDSIFIKTNDSALLPARSKILTRRRGDVSFLDSGIITWYAWLFWEASRGK